MQNTNIKNQEYAKTQTVIFKKKTITRKSQTKLFKH